MKVYVFTTHIVDDFEDIGICNQVFAKEQDAINALKEWRDDEIQYVERNEWIVEADNERNFEAYQDGCYCQNHSSGFVVEYEVK